MITRISLILIVLFLTGCNSRRIAAEKVPSVVRNTMVASYPALNNIEWEKHSNYYEAEADLNDSIELRMQINQAGTIIMKKLDITKDKLPEAVLKYVNANFKAYAIDDVELLEKDSKKYYQVELAAKGKRDVNLVFNQEGTPAQNISFWD